MKPVRCTVHPQEPWDNWYAGVLLEVTTPQPDTETLALVAEQEWSAQSNKRSQVRWVPLYWVKVDTHMALKDDPPD